MSRRSQRTDDFPVLIEFDNPVIASVDHPHMLIGRDAESIRISNVPPFLQKCSLRIKDLNSHVFPISHVNPACGIHCDAVREIELTRPQVRLWVNGILTGSIDRPQRRGGFCLAAGAR